MDAGECPACGEGPSDCACDRYASCKFVLLDDDANPSEVNPGDAAWPEPWQLHTRSPEAPHLCRACASCDS